MRMRLRRRQRHVILVVWIVGIALFLYFRTFGRKKHEPPPSMNPPAADAG